MANVELHGAEVRQQKTSPPIVVAGTNVVGLVGAATNSESAVAAKLAFGLGNAALVATAAAAGEAGNSIEVELIRPAAASQALSVTLAGRVIIVSLATGVGGNVSTTADDLVTAWAAAVTVVALATLADATGSTGADAVTPLGRTNLSGGLDEFAPLNTPTAVLTAADAERLGTAGSLPAAVADVWRAGGRDSPPIVVVRTDDDTAANLTGTRAAGTGAYALLKAEAAAGLKPQILACPGSLDNGVGGALEIVAGELGGVAVVGLDATTYSAAVTDKANYSTAFCIWPQFVVSGAAGEATRPAAGIVAGHIARIDGEVRPGASPSNYRIDGVLRASLPIDYAPSARNSTANLLNRANITTAIRRRGEIRLWGNRVANGEVLARRRTRAFVRTLMIEAVADYLDRDVDAPFVSFILSVVQLGLDRAQERGLLLPGSTVAFPTDKANTPATLEADQLTFDYHLRLASLSEHFIFRESVSVGLDLSSLEDR